MNHKLESYLFNRAIQLATLAWFVVAVLIIVISPLLVLARTGEVNGSGLITGSFWVSVVLLSLSACGSIVMSVTNLVHGGELSTNLVAVVLVMLLLITIAYFLVGV